VLRRLVHIRLELATRDVVGVLLDIGVPFLRQVVQREDRRNGADRNASAAVDTFDRVDEQLVHRIEPRPAIFVLRVLFRMNAIDRAGVHACSVFRSDAGFGNDICHSTLPKDCLPPAYTKPAWRARLLYPELAVRHPSGGTPICGKIGRSLSAAHPQFAHLATQMVRRRGRRLLGMDELSRQVLKLFIAMDTESLDLHTLFEAGGNDPAARQRVLDVVTHLADTGYLESQGSDFYLLTDKGRRAVR
jgi:hypothetical protein